MIFDSADGTGKYLNRSQAAAESPDHPPFENTGNLPQLSRILYAMYGFVQFTVSYPLQLWERITSWFWPNDAQVAEPNPVVIATTQVPSSLPVSEPIAAIDPSKTPGAFFDNKPLLSRSNSVAKRNFSNREELRLFLVDLEATIVRSEQLAPPIIIDREVKVGEQYITVFIERIKDPLADPSEFWSRLRQMSDHDIGVFVSKLSWHKDPGIRNPSTLDYLWRQFFGVELERSIESHQQTKFAVVLRALSTDQLKAAFDSPDFLKVLNNASYAATAANTLNREQWAWFAANAARQDKLKDLINEVKADAYQLGRLVALIPTVTTETAIPLKRKLSYLNQPTSLKNELISLTDHYLANTPIRPHASHPHHLNRSKSAPAKWAPVRAGNQRFYATNPVVKAEWTDPAFTSFLQRLKASDYLIDDIKLMADLDSMPDNRLKQLVEHARLPEYQFLLKHLWSIESKPLIHKSSIDDRLKRLQMLLESLSESQLIQSVADNKFWELVRNTKDPYCQVAADTLTAEQFRIILTHATLNRHADVGIILSKFTFDNSLNRVKQIVGVVLPFTTPWLVLPLERLITRAMARDKQLLAHSMRELKRVLSESLAKPEVAARYGVDSVLDKSAVSLLVVTLAESPTNCR